MIRIVVCDLLWWVEIIGPGEYSGLAFVINFGRPGPFCFCGQTIAMGIPVKAADNAVGDLIEQWQPFLTAEPVTEQCCLFPGQFYCGLVIHIQRATFDGSRAVFLPAAELDIADFFAGQIEGALQSYIALGFIGTPTGLAAGGA